MAQVGIFQCLLFFRKTERFGSNICFPFQVWCRDQSSWLQIQRSGFDSQFYQIFWEVVGLERGPLSLVSATEELLGRKSSGSGPGSRECGHRDPSCWPRGTLYLLKLTVASPRSGGRSVGIIRSRTQATGFVSFRFVLVMISDRGWVNPRA
jgi:hypothetical protein